MDQFLYKGFCKNFIDDVVNRQIRQHLILYFDIRLLNLFFILTF